MYEVLVAYELEFKVSKADFPYPWNVEFLLTQIDLKPGEKPIWVEDITIDSVEDNIQDSSAQDWTVVLAIQATTHLSGVNLEEAKGILVKMDWLPSFTQFEQYEGVDTDSFLTTEPKTYYDPPSNCNVA